MCCWDLIYFTKNTNAFYTLALYKIVRDEGENESGERDSPGERRNNKSLYMIQLHQTMIITFYLNYRLPLYTIFL